MKDDTDRSALDYGSIIKADHSNFSFRTNNDFLYLQVENSKLSLFQEKNIGSSSERGGRTAHTIQLSVMLNEDTSSNMGERR